MPHPPCLGFDRPLPPPGVALRRGHWSTDGLRAMLLPNSGSPSVRVYDPVRDYWTPIASLTHGSNSPTAHGLIQFPTVSDSIDVTDNQSTIINPRQITILLVRQKHDLSLIESLAFAPIGGGAGDRCLAHLPYSDGTVYWDFGGTVAGTTELAVAGLTFDLNPEAWAFVAGPHGMAMYRNGVLLGSHSTAASGPSSYTGTFQLNAGFGAGCRHTVSFFAVLDAEWNAQQVQEWSANQGCMFERRNVLTFWPAALVPGPVITIDGVERTIQPGWQISENLNERNTFRFNVLSLDGTYRPAARDVVEFRYDGTLIFAGHIQSTYEAGLGGYGVTAIDTGVGATDFNALPERRQVAITLAAGTLKSQLETIEPYLTAYGVSLDPEQVDGPTLDELVFEIGPLSAVLNKLSTITGFAWEIDYDLILRMYEPGTVAAPFDLADGDGQAIGDITVSPTTEQYANRVIVLAGTGTQDVNDAVGTGDGIETNFPLNYTLSTSYGYVTNDVTNETLRITGDPDSATWEYDPVTNSITRLTGAPANGNAISISYVAQFPFQAIAEDVPAQDGGANLVERTFIHPEIMDITTATALAAGYLVKSLVTPREIRYTTLIAGVHPGQSQYIECTDRNVDDDCLITGVDVTANGNVLRYQVRATEGLVIPETLAGKWRRTLARRVA